MIAAQQGDGRRAPQPHMPTQVAPPGVLGVDGQASLDHLAGALAVTEPELPVRIWRLLPALSPEGGHSWSRARRHVEQHQISPTMRAASAHRTLPVLHWLDVSQHIAGRPN
jgi:hypothetical protein